MFGRTWPVLDAPNFYAYSHGGPDTTAENAARFKPPAAAWSFAVGMRPKSRGSIHLTGPDPGGPCGTERTYLEDPQDLKDLISGVDLAREIGNSAALRPFTKREIAPG